MAARKKPTPWSCPKCGTNNSKVKDVCGMCGLLRPEDVAEVQGPPPLASQVTLQTKIPGICSHCYGDLELEIHPPGFCFYCNHRQPSEEEREIMWTHPPILPCVKCEADVKGLKFCSKCGGKVPEIKEIFAAARERVLKHRDQFLRSQKDEDYSRFAQDGGVSEVIMVEKQICGACNATVLPEDTRCGNCGLRLRAEITRVVKEAGVEEHERQMLSQGQSITVVSQEEAARRLAEAGDPAKIGVAKSPAPAKPASQQQTPRPAASSPVVAQSKQQQQQQGKPNELANMFKRFEMAAAAEQDKQQKPAAAAAAAGPPKPAAASTSPTVVRRTVVKKQVPAEAEAGTGADPAPIIEERINADGKRVIVRRVIKRVMVKKKKPSAAAEPAEQ